MSVNNKGPNQFLYLTRYYEFYFISDFKRAVDLIHLVVFSAWKPLLFLIQRKTIDRCYDFVIRVT